MTDLDLDTLRRLAEAATPGPWHATTFEDADADGVFDSGSECVAGLASGDDAHYIAAVSPDVVLALLDRLAELEAALGTLVTAIEAAQREDQEESQIESTGRAAFAALDAARALLTEVK